MRSKTMSRIAVLFVTAALAAGSAYADHRETSRAPFARAALIDSASDLERSAELLVQAVAREARGRNPHDRRAVDAAADILFLSRRLQRELFDGRIGNRELARLMDDLDDSFEVAEYALRRARVSRFALVRFDRACDDLNELERRAARVQFATYRKRGAFRPVFRAELDRNIRIGDRGDLDVHVVFRSGR